MNLGERKIHFVGIGGIGMSGIAEVLFNMGCRVTGSDLAKNVQVEHLQKLGIKIFPNHAADNVPTQCDTLVYSSAVKSDNPELAEARRRDIPIIQRAEMLAELMRLKRGIAVGGSHGKTTTTSMIASMMLTNRMDPTIVIGGRFDLIQSTAALGKGEWLLAEADESDGSFLRLSPEILVLTNIDNDHLDHFGDMHSLTKAFGQFASRIPFYGKAIFCVDDPLVAKLSDEFHKRHVSYGISHKADLMASDFQVNGFGQEMRVSLKGKYLGRLTLQVPGHHNALNALAAVAVGMELKIPFEKIAEGLQFFRGVDRRLQVRGQFKGVLVLDDYGHHPTEIAATLDAVRSVYPRQRLIVLFQPHRYTRTQSCWSQFTKCFKKADVVGLLDIYSAGEQKIDGISSEKLSKEIESSKTYYWKDQKSAIAAITKLVEPTDIVLTLGAGDVWKTGVDLINQS